MKTNQLMEVKIGEYGVLKIYHKDGFCSLESVLKLVNKSRELKDSSFKPLTMRDILSKVELWQFIIELNAVDFSNNYNEGATPSFKVSADYSILEEYKDSKGRIRYSELIKLFERLIKSKRGKNGGTWADLRIALKVASIVDKRIEAEIYTIVVKSDILRIRDNGGEEFKKLNILIDSNIKDWYLYTDNPYRDVAILVNKKVNDKFSKGWNDKDKDSAKQKEREDIIKNLSFAVKAGLITGYTQLCNLIKSL